MADDAKMLPSGYRPLVILLVILAALLLALNRCGVPRPDSGGLAANGQLQVQGGRLVNQTGQPIQLRGLSSHGLIWFPQYANSRALADLRARGANLFRAAMYADSVHEGFNENETTRRLNRSLMYLAIENALAADMYVIVDWHLLLDRNPLFTVEAAKEFFDDISSRYAGQPGLIYEICNEPNGETTWADIREYARQVIPVIRRNSPQAVVLVGTPHYSVDLLSVRESPLSYDNIMYAYHLYFDDAPADDYQTKINAMREAGLGVFVSEWGIGRPRANSEAAAVIGDFLEYCRRHQISWANWSLSNVDESYSALKSECRKLSGWAEDDLTFSGRIVFNALRDQ